MSITKSLRTSFNKNVHHVSMTTQRFGMLENSLSGVEITDLHLIPTTRSYGLVTTTVERR